MVLLTRNNRIIEPRISNYRCACWGACRCPLISVTVYRWSISNNAAQQYAQTALTRSTDSHRKFALSCDWSVKFESDKFMSPEYAICSHYWWWCGLFVYYYYQNKYRNCCWWTHNVLFHNFSRSGALLPTLKYCQTIITEKNSTVKQNKKRYQNQMLQDNCRTNAHIREWNLDGNKKKRGKHNTS